MPDKTKKLTTQILIKSLDQSLKEFVKMHPGDKYPEAGNEENGNGTSILVAELTNGDFFQFIDSHITEEKPYQLIDGWDKPMCYHPWKTKH